MFDDHFEAVLADTAEARRINFQIRFQVYCLETGFEDALEFPDGLERDAWDESAAHFLVRSRASGEWVGAMRLIMPNSRLLPIERYCAIDERVATQLPRSELGEVSRLCMVAHYRRRVQEPTYPYEFPVQSAGYGQGRRVLRERRREPEILFGLLRAALQFSRERQVRYWYILGTPALSRMISRYNVRMQAVGPLCEHRGGRYPYWANLDVEAKRASRGSAKLSLFLKRTAYRRFSELGSAADGAGDRVLLESAPS